MNIRMLFFCWSVISLLGSSDANAQAKQTVAGAQQFLQGLNAGGGSGSYPLYAVRGFNTFDGLQASLGYWQKAIDDIDESDKHNPCVTRITDIGQRPRTIAKGVIWSVGNRTVLSLPVGGFPLPRYIHWGKVSINRQTVVSGDEAIPIHYVYASQTMPGGGEESVGFSPRDAGMADRIEYAMKFLQASCDESASTGF